MEFMTYDRVIFNNFVVATWNSQFCDIVFRFQDVLPFLEERATNFVVPEQGCKANEHEKELKSHDHRLKKSDDVPYAGDHL